MLRQGTSPSEHGEEARAFLQQRLALFWKVLCIFMLLATALGMHGSFNRHWHADLLIDAGLAAEAGLLWAICRRGAPSIRALRVLEAVGTMTYFAGSSFLGRYVLVGFVHEKAVVTAEGTLMADAYLAALGLVGAALWMVLRAALVPSSPRRTALYTAMVGVPLVSTPQFFGVGADGELAFHAFDSTSWKLAGMIMVWGFVIITSTIMSHVIYGLRAQVREARRLGQYVLEQKLGEGGMGEVYRARHGMMRRPSALKLVRADRAAASYLVRFEREVQLTARLTHPNTITIFDYGRTDDGVFYYAMELLDGANLHRVVDVGGPQPEARVVRILMMACGALAEAHGIGLIHRDIKPANLMLCTQGGELDVVKLLDFGLVKELSVDGDSTVSMATTLTGTPQYMAPESITNAAEVDARADLYALGAVAYFLLAGAHVFDGKSIVEVCSQHLHQPPPPLASRGVTVSPELEAVVLSCLEKKPALRPQSAAELRQRLAACGVAPWTADDARAWWQTHGPRLDDEAGRRLGEARTIAVAGGGRSETLSA